VSAQRVAEFSYESSWHFHQKNMKHKALTYLRHATLRRATLFAVDRPLKLCGIRVGGKVLMGKDQT
jgi:hypothetical protein